MKKNDVFDNLGDAVAALARGMFTLCGAGAVYMFFSAVVWALPAAALAWHEERYQHAWILLALAGPSASWWLAWLWRRRQGCRRGSGASCGRSSS